MVIIPLMALLVAAIPVQVHAMHYYGNGITEDGYIYADVGGGVKIVEYRGKQNPKWKSAEILTERLWFL